MNADQIDDLTLLRAILAAVAFHGMACDPHSVKSTYATLARLSVEVANTQIDLIRKGAEE